MTISFGAKRRLTKSTTNICWFLLVFVVWRGAGDADTDAAPAGRREHHRRRRRHPGQSARRTTATAADLGRYGMRGVVRQAADAVRATRDDGAVPGTAVATVTEV